MAQVALAWCINKPGTYPVIAQPCGLTVSIGVAAAVVGTTSLKNLTEVLGMSMGCSTCRDAKACLGSVNVSLSDEEVKYLEEPYTAQAFYMD